MGIQRAVLGILIIISLSNCKKDPAILSSEDTSIHNDIIAGGGVMSFQRIIGGPKLDGLHSVKQTSDGGYVFCGFTENEDASEKDIYLIRTNASGETLWTKRFSGSFTDQGWFVEITSDNGFILAATSNVEASNSSNHNYNGQLIKTDSNGNQEWKQSYTFGNYTNFTTVRQTSDGGFIVCGSEMGTTKGFLLKTDLTGNESWRKTFGGLVELNHVSKTIDGGFILCGITKSTSSSASDEYIIKTNSLGDTLWTKTYGDFKDNTASSIMETATGNFILCGNNANPGISGFAQLLNSTGGQIWNTDFSSLNVSGLLSINLTSDNQFIAVGYQTAGSPSKALLQKIDALGNNVWIKFYNPNAYNTFYEVQVTSDNGFISGGYTLTAGNGNAYILKTDVNGN